jgi:hypothetical protein
MENLKTYEIVWRNKDLGVSYREDGTKSETERNNVQAVDEAHARDVFDGLYGHCNYEIMSVQLYDDTKFAKWLRARNGNQG